MEIDNGWHFLILSRVEWPFKSGSQCCQLVFSIFCNFVFPLCCIVMYFAKLCLWSAVFAVISPWCVCHGTRFQSLVFLKVKYAVNKSQFKILTCWQPAPFVSFLQRDTLVSFNNENRRDTVISLGTVVSLGTHSVTLSEAPLLGQRYSDYVCDVDGDMVTEKPVPSYQLCQVWGNRDKSKKALADFNTDR